MAEPAPFLSHLRSYKHKRSCNTEVCAAVINLWPELRSVGRVHSLNSNGFIYRIAQKSIRSYFSTYGIKASMTTAVRVILRSLYMFSMELRRFTRLLSGLLDWTEKCRRCHQRHQNYIESTMQQRFNL